MRGRYILEHILRTINSVLKNVIGFRSEKLSVVGEISMEEMDEESIKRAMWLDDEKCASNKCWNFRVDGYVYCGNCLYGTPTKMSKEDIALLTRFRTLNDV